MPTILIVEKNGSIKPSVVKNAVESELYKKAGFKSAEGFQKQTTWKLNIDDTDFVISLYGKTTGKANTENKYEFPPPVDSVLYFGNCILVNIQDGNFVDLHQDDWELIYQYLYGGFEDLSEDEDEDEDDELVGLEKTKDGYAKDGFIVDDDEEDDFESDSELELSSVDSSPKKTREKNTKGAVAQKKTKNTKPTTTAGSKGKGKQAFVETENEEVDAILDCTSELSEDEYD